MGVLDQRFEKNFMITSVDYVFNWARKSAIWPLTFGLACCAIEMIASTTSRFDMARFGAEVFRPSPRQADLMIVAGTVTLKMAPVLKLFFALLKLQDKIDQMTLAKRPTEVRLKPHMVEEFKKGVMVAQTPEPK